MPEPADRLGKALRRRTGNPPCAICRHQRADHGVDRNGRVVCWGASCGCGGYVPGGAA